MSKFYEIFLRYLQNSTPKIKIVFAVALIFYGIFLICEKKGYTRKSNQRIITKVYGVLWSLTSAFIVVMTLFRIPTRDYMKFVIIPLQSWSIVIESGNMELLLQIIMNIVMYIPLGILLPCCFKVYEKISYIILTALISSGIIEVLQLFLKIGLFEVDDIINNVFGTVIGIGIYRVMKYLLKFCRKSILNKMGEMWQ